MRTITKNIKHFKAIRDERSSKVSLFGIINIVGFCLLGLIMVYPFWYVILGSITPFADFVKNPLMVIPKNPTFAAYNYVFKSKAIMPALGLSATVTIIGTISSVLMTTLGAYIFSLKKFPGQSLMFNLILFTMLFGGGVIPMFKLLNTIGIYDTPIVYVLPSLINTFYMLILRTSFAEIPEDVKAAASIDGCNHFQLLISIVFPLSLPAIATIALFYTVDRWNDLYTGIYYTESFKNFNIQIVLYNMLSGQNQGGAIGSLPIGGGGVMESEQVKYACILVSALPMLVVYPFLQRYFTKGVMLGAIKA